MSKVILAVLSVFFMANVAFADTNQTETLFANITGAETGRTATRDLKYVTDCAVSVVMGTYSGVVTIALSADGGTNYVTFKGYSTSDGTNIYTINNMPYSHIRVTATDSFTDDTTRGSVSASWTKREAN